MQDTLLLVPNPGSLGVYETRLQQWYGCPVAVSRHPSASEHPDVTEFGGVRPRLARRLGLDGLLDRFDYAAWPPPGRHDVVLSTGSVGKEVRPRPGQHHVHLAHGLQRGGLGLPPRDEYSSSRFLRLFQQWVRQYVDIREREAYRAVDTLVVNSPFTRRVIEHYLDVEVDAVIHPPVDVESFADHEGTGSTDDYYLFLGRLDPIKRVVEIVEAFDELPYRLVVAGDGPCRNAVEAAAGEGVDVLGYVSEDEKRRLMVDAAGFVQNSVAEDFGMTTVEALAAGTPVVAVDDGNNPNLVEDGRNGLLYHRGEDEKPFRDSSAVPALRDAVQRHADRDWDRETVRSTAARYDSTACRTRWDELLEARR